MTRLFDRRRVLNWFLGGSTFAWMGSVIYPVLRFLSPPPEQEASVSTVKATTLSEMAPNSGQNFKFGRKPALIVRRPDGSFGAFLAKCTHLDCVVQYRADNWLRCWFCGIDTDEVPITMARTVEAWQVAMSQVFAELYRVVRPGGHVAFEVG